MKSKLSHVISVSELKSILLSVIRNVEKGHQYEITKANKKVAVIFPWKHVDVPTIGFAEGKILDNNLDLPHEDWTYDMHNLKASYE